MRFLEHILKISIRLLWNLNPRKIKAHSKRVLLEYLKYIGIIYHDEYIDFMKRSESVDLTFIDNGNFIRDAVKLYNESVELWQDAKISETSNVSEEVMLAQRFYYVGIADVVIGVLGIISGIAVALIFW